MFRTALALILLSSPAFAAELNKADVEKIAATYMEKFPRTGRAGIATLFTKDGLHVDQTGFRNVAEYYGEAFKAGSNKLDAAVDQVHPVAAEMSTTRGNKPCGRSS